MLELKKKNWREYLKSDNPVAAALLSKMGYKEEEKVEVWKAFLRMMLRMKLNPADTKFINDFFQEYLILNEEEEELLMEEISQLENADEFITLSNSWEDRGIKRGIEKVVIEMLKEGSSIEFITKVTNLDKDAIEELRKS